MKTCYKCKKEKFLIEFSKNKSRVDGLSSHCKSCHKEMRRKHYVSNKTNILNQVLSRKKELREWVDSLKKEKPCKDCGKVDLPFLMDFDHIEKKEFSISKSWMNGFSKEKILKEIKKCELVCCRCHRIRTHSRY